MKDKQLIANNALAERVRLNLAIINSQIKELKANGCAVKILIRSDTYDFTQPYLEIVVKQTL